MLKDLLITKTELKEAVQGSQKYIEEALNEYGVLVEGRELSGIGRAQLNIQLPFTTESNRRQEVYLATCREASEMAVEIVAMRLNGTTRINFGAERYLKLLGRLASEIEVPENVLVDVTIHSVFAPNFQNETQILKVHDFTPITVHRLISQKVRELAGDIDIDESISIAQLIALCVSVGIEMNDESIEFYQNITTQDTDAIPSIPYGGGFLDIETGEIVLSHEVEYPFRIAAILTTLITIYFAANTVEKPGIINLVIFFTMLFVSASTTYLTSNFANYAKQLKIHEVLHGYEIHIEGNSLKLGLITAERGNSIES